jgi:hypothetical protein
VTGYSVIHVELLIDRNKTYLTLASDFRGLSLLATAEFGSGNPACAIIVAQLEKRTFVTGIVKPHMLRIIPLGDSELVIEGKTSDYWADGHPLREVGLLARFLRTNNLRVI